MSATDRASARPMIRPAMTVRRIAADFPGSQSVFRRYGELERPGVQFGHCEPLTHFARRHGIPIEVLMTKLSAATGAPFSSRVEFVERVHHAFLSSALLITLSLGAGWGAWILWQIGRRGSFDAVPAASVIAHGEAQLWGFIALFIIGISLHTALQTIVRHPLGAVGCRALLAFGLLGIAGGFAWYLWPAQLTPLGVISGVSLLLMAAIYWLLQVAALRTKWRSTWVRAVLISGMWLVIWAAVTIDLRWWAGAAGLSAYTDSQRLLLIELAVLGFAMNSIYGFGQMLLPGLLRIGSTRSWAIELSHGVHNAGVLIVCIGTVYSWSAAVMAAGCVLLVAAATLFAVGIRGFIGRRRTTRREEQGHALLDFYPPLAFFWLATGLLLMAGGFVYEATTGTGLPHAYMGAVRHAITVGFMTTLIMGVGQRLLPVLDHKVLPLPGLILPILILIAMGNLLRVVLELATMAVPAAFLIIPYSALLEWLALALFTISCAATMYGSDSIVRRGRATKRSSLAVLLAEYPWVEDRLIAYGISYLERTRSVPLELTIGSAAEGEGHDANALVDEINTWLDAATAANCPATAQ